MTKRLYSTEQVLDALLSDDEEWDDQGEPMMEGSDEEFSELDDDDDVDPPALAEHLIPPSPQDSPSSLTLSVVPTSILSFNSSFSSSHCSTYLLVHYVESSDHQALHLTVGPTVPIPESPAVADLGGGVQRFPWNPPFYLTIYILLYNIIYYPLPSRKP